MSKPCCIVNKHCVHALNWPWPFPIGTHKWSHHTSHCDVMNRYHQSDVFLFNHDHLISVLNFPVNDLCHDAIGNKLFGFVFSRSDEPIMIGVCGMRWANQDHRIRSDPIEIVSFLELGPGCWGQGRTTYMRSEWPKYWQASSIQICSSVTTGLIFSQILTINSQ